MFYPDLASALSSPGLGNTYIPAWNKVLK